MAEQADNIFRQLQEDVLAELDAAGITATLQQEPATADAANVALNDSGIFTVVGYPTIGLQENRIAQVDVPVQVITNPEVAKVDGFDLAVQIAGALDENQLDNEWWTELRLMGIDPTGTEDGLVVWTVRIQTRTAQTVEMS
jgi:hypothetical protein